MRMAAGLKCLEVSMSFPSYPGEINVETILDADSEVNIIRGNEVAALSLPFGEKCFVSGNV
jgi:hypothetical protein